MARWYGLVIGLLCGTVAYATPTTPGALALAAAGNMVIGNSTKVVFAATPSVAAPLACDGALLLAERSRVGTVHARTGVTTRLLATVDGDVAVATGGTDFGPHTHVTGGVAAGGNVVVGLASVIDGAICSRGGGVSAARLVRLRGDVFAARDWRGDRDVVIGSPGTSLAVKGRALLRDRAEYFATVLYEGAVTLVSGGPTLHAPVTQVPSGTLHAAAADGFTLERVDLPDVVAGGIDRTIADDEALAPGVYGKLVLGQRATLRIVAGTYVFASVEANSDARIVADLGAAPAPLRLLVDGDVKLGRRVRLDLPGTEAATAAPMVLVQANGVFQLDADGVLAGTVLARRGVTLGKHVTLTGAAWSGGPLAVGRDSTVAWVPSALAW